jgi:hypothetical protein
LNERKVARRGGKIDAKGVYFCFFTFKTVLGFTYLLAEMQILLAILSLRNGFFHSKKQKRDTTTVIVSL